LLKISTGMHKLLINTSHNIGNFSKTTERGLQVFSERRYLFRLLYRYPVTQYYDFMKNRLGLHKKIQIIKYWVTRLRQD